MTAHIKLWLAIFLLLVLAVPFIATEDQLRANAGRELELMRSALGKSDTDSIIQSANGIYSAVFVKTGLIGSIQSKTTYESDRKEAGDSLGRSFYQFTSATNNYLLSLSILTYIMILRLVMLLQWVPFLLPFLVAAFIDGLVQHKILHSSVAVSNPVKHKLASHATVIGMALPIAYLFSPVAITPYFIVVWALAMALPMSIVIRETAPFSYR